MEKQNDAMTICTLAKPDVIPININAYKKLVMLQEHYDLLINILGHAVDVDDDGKPTIDWNGKNFLLNAFSMLEPEAFDEAVSKAKERKGVE